MAPQSPTDGQVIRLVKRQIQKDSGLKPTFENMVLKSNLNNRFWIVWGYCFKSRLESIDLCLFEYIETDIMRPRGYIAAYAV